MTTAYFTRTTAGGFRSGGRDYTFAQVADAIRDCPWATINYHGDVVANADKDYLARRYGQPVTGAELAQRLAA